MDDKNKEYEEIEKEEDESCLLYTSTGETLQVNIINFALAACQAFFLTFSNFPRDRAHFCRGRNGFGRVTL